MYGKTILLFYLFLVPAFAFDYQLFEAGGIELADQRSKISDLKSVFIGSKTGVTVTDIAWEPNSTGKATENSTTIIWKTYVDGILQDTGTEPLDGVGRELPTRLNAGTIAIEKGGKAVISVKLSLSSTSDVTVTNDVTAEGSYQVYSSGVSIIPLLLILFLAFVTQMVELSLFTGVFVAACIVTGNIEDGFRTMLDKYITGALADEGHVMVILFSVFLSGLVGMMQKSGGMEGAVKLISKWAKTPRLGQLACFSIGILIFFDDYANLLLTGESMRPLMDLLSISREKLSFIIDATAAPVASLSPISSWVGYEVSLIQGQVNRLVEIYGEENLTISTTGYGVFLQSIKYRYYPIFMLFMMFSLIILQRDFGPMLIAERKVRAYKRTDGGDGSTTKAGLASSENNPARDTPHLAWNMLLPIALLVFFILYLLVLTGTDVSKEQTFFEKIEGSDSYIALLHGTMATTLLTLMFYHIQIVNDGKFVFKPDLKILKDLTWFSTAEKPDGRTRSTRFLMDVPASVDSFLVGMARLFPALVVLTLAWATGTAMQAVGTDRLFTAAVSGNVDASWFPTLSFIISFLIALATGSSWGAMAILFPILLVPTYEVSDGDAIIFYATTAGILSGSVAGDHVSPISDTTVLASLASDCSLIRHIETQAPYVLCMVVLSILLGTIPVGFGWHNAIGVILGLAIIIPFTFFYAKPVLSATGDYDLMQELYLKLKSNSELVQLKEAVVKAYNESVGSTNAKDVGQEEATELKATEEGKKMSEEQTKEVPASDVESKIKVDGGDVVETKL